jgi:hypothetical protein
MADVNNVQSFLRFPQLPKEVQLMIWEMALLCLRIVSVEMRSLKKSYLEWEREKEVSNKTAENTRDSETMPEASRATSHDCERPGVDPLDIDGYAFSGFLPSMRVCVEVMMSAYLLPGSGK